MSTVSKYWSNRYSEKKRHRKDILYIWMAVIFSFFFYGVVINILCYLFSPIGLRTSSLLVRVWKISEKTVALFWKRYQQSLQLHIYLREGISDGIGQNEIVEYHLAVPWNLNFRYQAILKEKLFKDFQISAKYGASRTLHTSQMFTVLLDAYLYTKGC